MSERFDYDGLLEVNQALRDECDRLREALETCEQACESGRLHLVKVLTEPGRTVFWELVAARDRAQAALTPAAGGTRHG